MYWISLRSGPTVTLLKTSSCAWGGIGPPFSTVFRDFIDSTINWTYQLTKKQMNLRFNKREFFAALLYAELIAAATTWMTRSMLWSVWWQCALHICGGSASKHLFWNTSRFTPFIMPGIHSTNCCCPGSIGCTGQMEEIAVIIMCLLRPNFKLHVISMMAILVILLWS